MNFRLLILSVFTFTSVTSYCQSLYEFDYEFNVNKKKEHYTAFVFRDDDGTGFMRVRFQDPESNKWVLVEMSLAERYLGEDPADHQEVDTTILILEGKDPQVVEGPSKIEYDPDLFIFQYDPNTDDFVPHSVLSGDGEDHESEGKINDIRQLDEKDLTREFITKYFTEKDDIYQNLFEEATVRQLTPQQQKTQLFLLLVANTDDISIGSTCAVDKDATFKTFSAIAEFLGITFTPKVIFGKDFSKANVDNALRELQPGKNDIVVFYYSGHGFSNTKDNRKYPYLDLRDKISQSFGGVYTMNIEDIYQTIKAKGARFNLVLSDCCNSDPTLTNATSGDMASTRHSSVGWNVENCRNLFLQPKPMSVLVTAASKGELSAGNSSGGIFTFNFREAMERSLGPFYNLLTWDQILKLSQTQTANKAKHTWCIQEDNSRKVCEQNPVYKLDY